MRRTPAAAAAAAVELRETTDGGKTSELFYSCSRKPIRPESRPRPTAAPWWAPMAILATMRGVLSDVLLPVGFPSSVAPEYIQFQIYDTLFEAMGYFRGLLSSQALLTGLGVGSAGTSPVGAVIQTMVLNYCGMVTGLVVGSARSWVPLFSADMKFWQFVKEVFTLCGTMLEFIAASYPQHFVKISACGAFLCAIGTVIGACSRAPLVAHLARRNNFADCAAKEGNQSRMLKLLAIAAGYRFLTFVNEVPWRAAVAFVALCVFKLYFLHKSMSVLALRTVNNERLELLLESWFSRNWTSFTPLAVSKRESVAWPLSARAREAALRLGGKETVGPLLAAGGGGCEPERLLSFYAKEKAPYLLLARSTGQAGSAEVAGALAPDATPADMIQVRLHAYLLKGQLNGGSGGGGNGSDAVIIADRVQETYRRARAQTPAFIKALQGEGWDLQDLLVSPAAEGLPRVEMSSV